MQVITTQDREVMVVKLQLPWHRGQRVHSHSVPLLGSARMHGDPKSWPGEKLERLLTPREMDQVRRGRI